MTRDPRFKAIAITTVFILVVAAMLALVDMAKAESYYPPQISIEPEVNYCLLAGIALDAGTIMYSGKKLPMVGEAVIINADHMDIIHMVLLYTIGCIGNLAEANADNDDILFFSYIQQLSEISQ